MRICPVCRARIEDLEQRTCCIYSVPCGHRIGKGSAEVLMRWYRSVETTNLPLEEGEEL